MADPLLAFVLDELLDPAAVGRAVEIVNRRLRAGGSVRDDRRTQLEAEIQNLEGETRRLAEAIAGGLVVEAVADTLRARDGRLRAARAELAALPSGEQAAPPPRPWSAQDVLARLEHFRENLLQKADPEKTRAALARIFESVGVEPLGGSWERGWALDVKARPWSVMLPKCGSGGRI